MGVPGVQWSREIREQPGGVQKTVGRSQKTKDRVKRGVNDASPRRSLWKGSKTATGTAARRKVTDQNGGEKKEEKVDDTIKGDDNPTRDSGARGRKQKKVERAATLPGAEQLDGVTFGNEGEEVPEQAHHIKIPICNLNTVAYKSEASKGGCSQSFEASWNQFMTELKVVDGAQFASFPIFGKAHKVVVSKNWNQRLCDKVDLENGGKKAEHSKGRGPASMDWALLQMKDSRGGGEQVLGVNHSSDSDEEE